MSFNKIWKSTNPQFGARKSKLKVSMKHRMPPHTSKSSYVGKKNIDTANATGSRVISSKILLSSKANEVHSPLLNICDDMKKNVRLTKQPIMRSRADSLFNLKIKPYIHTGVDEGDARKKKKLKEKVLKKLVGSIVEKEPVGAPRLPPIWYDRISLFLPRREFGPWECRKTALIHDFLKEAADEKLALDREIELFNAVTEKTDEERSDRRSLITGQHRVFMRMAAHHMNVPVSKIEDGIVDDIRCINLLNNVLIANGSYYVIFTWKVKRFKVYNLKDELLRVYDEKRVQVTDGIEDGCLDYFLLIYRIRNDFTAELKQVYDVC